MSIRNASPDRIKNHINEFLPEIIEIRHDLHAHPELGFKEYRTSDIVAGLLEQWGYQVTRGLGKTGVVGTLSVGSGTRAIGIRADMDALPVQEMADVPYVSKNDGVMHACGHDGHTAILLAAARYLSETRHFDGTVNLIFQPAEEGYAGARLMMQDGLFKKFPCDAVYGLHNMPGLPEGVIHFTKGPMMASCATVCITIKGKGGHGAMPHNTIDPIVAASSTVMALQTIISRNVSPLDQALISCGLFQGGTIANIIPESVKLELTVRSFLPEVRALLKERLFALVKSQAESYGTQAEITYEEMYPTLVNHDAETAYLQEITRGMFGEDKVVSNFPPVMPSEDFAYMLEKCPGSYVFLGNGEGKEVHNPYYIFNDGIILVGASLWGALVEDYLNQVFA